MNDHRPSWHPPNPFERATLEANEIARRQFAEVHKRGGSILLDDLRLLVDQIGDEVRRLSDDDLAIRELRANLKALQEQRDRYDALSKRPSDLGPKGRGERERLWKEHAEALAEAEGTWRAVPGTDVHERVSRISGRDEYAILEAGKMVSLAAAETVRELRLDPIEAGKYQLVLYTVPYYSERVPTVEQMWIEQAMMRAPARLIGLARYGSKGSTDPVARGARDIKRTIERMFERGTTLPVDAKYVSVSLTQLSADYIADSLHTA